MLEQLVRVRQHEPLDVLVEGKLSGNLHDLLHDDVHALLRLGQRIGARVARLLRDDIVHLLVHRQHHDRENPDQECQDDDKAFDEDAVKPIILKIFPNLCSLYRILVFVHACLLPCNIPSANTPYIA